MLIRGGDAAAACASFERAVALAPAGAPPDDPAAPGLFDFCCNAANAYLALQRPKLAEPLLRRAEEQRPDDPEVRACLASHRRIPWCARVASHRSLPWCALLRAD